MGVMINRRRVYGGKKLPYDAEIEYLESTGTQWIDTGITLISNMRMSVTYQIVKFRDNTVLVGSNNSKSNMYSIGMFEWQGNYHCTTNYSKTTSHGILKALDHFVTVEKKENKTFSGGTTIVEDTIQNTFTLGKCLLFYASGIHEQPFVNPALVRIAAFSLKDNSDNLLCDLIPVRVGSTGYMYDKVSKQLFGNAGTGKFILGPDK